MQDLILIEKSQMGLDDRVKGLETVTGDSANADPDRKIENTKGEGKSGMSPFERVIAISGIILGAITAIFFWVQLKEMTYQTQILASQSEGANAGALMDEMSTRRQLAIAQEQARAMQDSVETAKKSIEAGNRQSKAALDASTETTKLDQRAWFGIADFKILQYDRDDAKQPFRMQIEFKNTGKTPARQIHVYGVFGIHNSRAEGPSDTEWKSFMNYYAQDTGRYIAAPSATRKYIVGDFGDNPTEAQLFRNLYTQNFSAIGNGSKFLSYFGQATYIDIYDKVRTTKFCLILGDSETKQLAHCGKGNEMD